MRKVRVPIRVPVRITRTVRIRTVVRVVRVRTR